MTPDHSAQPAEGVEALPKLPAPQKECWLGHQLFSAEQMHEYARRTLAASRGEAVAWRWRNPAWPGGQWELSDREKKPEKWLVVEPLYTTPTPDARVRELVDKWWTSTSMQGDEWNFGYNHALKKCADELTAALAAMDQETE